MFSWYFYLLTVGLILCFFHVSCANGVFVVEKVSYFGVQNVTFCKRCKPGYQASKFCQDAIVSGIYKSIDEENAIYLYNNFQVSSCTPCPVGKFSVGYVENQTCLKCSYCEPGFFASKSCNSTSDTLCIPDTFKGVHEYYFKSKKPLSFTSSPRGLDLTMSAATFATLTKPGTKFSSESPHVKTFSVLTALIICICVVIFCTSLLLSILKGRKNNKAYVTGRGIELIKSDAQTMTLFEDSVEFIDTFYSPSGNCKGNLSSPTSEKDAFFQCNAPRRCLMNEYDLEKMQMENQPEIDCPEQIRASQSCDVHDDSNICEVGNENIPTVNDTEDCAYYNYDGTIQTVFGAPCVSSNCESMRELSDQSNLSIDSCILESDQVREITLHEVKTFGHEGGYLHIEGTSVHIKVPKGAINKNEMKEIDVKVKIGRPNDWKELRENGYTIDLPQVELGPNGSWFNKPIELMFENASVIQDDVLFEFTEGCIDLESVWLPALECSSRKEAKKSALTKTPHVAFYIGEKYLHAFYLHFTGGRKKKKIPKDVWLQSAAYLKVDNLIDDCFALKVVFYEQTEEGKTLLAEELKGFKEVSVTPKPINVVGKENPAVEAVIDSIKNSWAVEQGQERQFCSLAPVFDPKCICRLPSIDFVVQKTDHIVTDFRCTIDILHSDRKHHDLKVMISKDAFYHPMRLRTASSGYLSQTESKIGDIYIINDADFKTLEPRAYMMKIFLKLAEFMAGYFKKFSRNLGMEHHVIEKMSLDYQQDSEEACYKLLVHWINNYPDFPNFKREMLRKLQVAIKSTNPPFDVHLPGDDQIEGRETTV